MKKPSLQTLQHNDISVEKSRGAVKKFCIKEEENSEIY